MKTIKMLTLCGMLALGGIGAGWCSDVSGEPVAPAEVKAPQAAKPIVQIALLLDTSGSMDGLINQARAQLWKVVNEFALAERGGQKPVLQVALFEYGNDRILAENGFIRQVLPLTNDLDKVSEELFKLSTNGGQEYCGQVIQAAVSALSWNADKSAYKAIFIAGNEAFTQGPVNYADACQLAIQKGIVVNTIFCGDSNEGINTKWQDGATLADGKYLSINQNQAVVHITAPQDEDIAKLGMELNKTYVSFGKRGRESLERQEKQDSNAAAAAPGAPVQRALAKASAQYCNSSWDMVDACKVANRKMADFKDEELPEEMKKMTLAERTAYVDKLAAEREALQKRIETLNKDRRAFVAGELKKNADKSAESLDGAMIKTIREQAGTKNLKFE
jgi:hypothetical protein